MIPREWSVTVRVRRVWVGEMLISISNGICVCVVVVVVIVAVVLVVALMVAIGVVELVVLMVEWEKWCW